MPDWQFSPIHFIRFTSSLPLRLTNNPCPWARFFYKVKQPLLQFRNTFLWINFGVIQKDKFNIFLLYSGKVNLVFDTPDQQSWSILVCHGRSRPREEKCFPTWSSGQLYSVVPIGFCMSVVRALLAWWCCVLNSDTKLSTNSSPTTLSRPKTRGDEDRILLNKECQAKGAGIEESCKLILYDQDGDNPVACLTIDFSDVTFSRRIYFFKSIWTGVDWQWMDNE